MPDLLLEIACETPAEAAAAQAAGAGRVELCADLDVGGLTPGLDLVTATRAALTIPFVVMVRPRAGGFVFTPAEVDRMAADAGPTLAAGADGIVFGAITPDGEVDRDVTARLVAAAGAAETVFHRAFDRVRDQAAALETLIGLGVTRVLTSGGAATGLEGADRLRELVIQAKGRIGILAGGGIRPDNMMEVVRRSGVSEVHRRFGPDLTAG